MKTKRKWLMAGIVLGVLLMLGSLVCMLGNMFGMYQAIDTMMAPGITDPKAFSSQVNASSSRESLGPYLLLPGMIIFAFSLIFYLRAGLVLARERAAAAVSQ